MHFKGCQLPGCDVEVTEWREAAMCDLGSPRPLGATRRGYLYGGEFRRNTVGAQPDDAHRKVPDHLFEYLHALVHQANPYKVGLMELQEQFIKLWIRHATRIASRKDGQSTRGSASLTASTHFQSAIRLADMPIAFVPGPQDGTAQECLLPERATGQHLLQGGE